MYQEVSQQPYYLPEHDSKQALGFNPRVGFVRKVYGIVSIQLLITSIFVYLCTGPIRSLFYDSARRTYYQAPFALFIICAVVSMIVSLFLTCYSSIARKVPTNYILLGLFTFCETYIVGFVTVFAEPSDVLLAAVLAMTMTLVLTLYACTTKTDITMWGAALWIAGWALLTFSLLFFIIAPRNAAYNTVVIAVAVLTIVVYGFYLIYDTQLIMGGKRYELSIDDYVVAALVLYIDIIVLFLKILEILNRLRR